MEKQEKQETLDYILQFAWSCLDGYVLAHVTASATRSFSPYMDSLTKLGSHRSRFFVSQ